MILAQAAYTNNFLATLLNQPHQTEAAGPVRRPWKALDYFVEEDAKLFFGRDADRDALLSHIISFRSTVLYGASGTGKTSLLNAAVIPALHSIGYRTARFRVVDDPLTTLRAAIYRAWPTGWSSPFAEQQTPDWLLADEAPRPGARSRLQELLTTRLSLDELQILVASLHEHSPTLYYDNLQGGLDMRVNGLLGFLEQRNQLVLLVRELYASRPDMRPDLIRLWASAEARRSAYAPLDQIQLPEAPLPPLVVVCDEFEKFFFDEFVPPLARRPFIAEIARTAQREDLQLTWLFSLRKEALGDLFTYFEPLSRSLIAHLYRLDPLTRTEAAQAVVGPADQSGLTLEEGLVETLLGDLEANGEVSPPQLQLVCDALYDQAQERQTSLITLSDYRGVGGTNGILQNYLARVLEHFPLSEIQVVKELLIQLAGAQQTTLALSLATLAERLEQPPGLVRRLLERLTEACLIRQVLVDAQETYELTHAYLINEITSWLGHEALALKRIQDLVSQGVRNQALGVRLPLSAEALDLVFPLRASLHLAREERRLVWHSAVLRGDQLREWCMICRDENDQLSILHAEPPLPRAHVIEALRWIGSAAAEKQLLRLCLEDPDPTSRQLAAAHLADTESTRVQSYLIKQSRNSSRTRRARCVAALAVFRDREKLTQKLSRRQQLSVGRQLIRLRLRRNSVYIIYLAIGAALGSLPFFTILPVFEQRLRNLHLEPIGVGFAIGLGVGQSIAKRRARLATLLGAFGGGFAGGLIAGILNIPGAQGLSGWPRYALYVLFFGFMGGLCALFGGLGMLLATRRADTAKRRIIGLMLGGAGAPAALLVLAVMVMLIGKNPDLSPLVYPLGDSMLIGLGIGLADLLYRREHIERPARTDAAGTRYILLPD